MLNVMKTVRRFVMIAAIVTVLPAIARADFGNRVLQLASGTVMQGTHNFFATGLSAGQNRTLDVNVDFAVWAPGQYTGQFNNFAGAAISVPATNYTYAYQIYNNGIAGNPNWAVFSELGVSVLGPITAIGQDKTYDPSAFDVGASSLSSTTISGATYFFISPRINPGSFSAVLLISSALPPALSNATVKDSGLSDHGLLPTPVPAPGAVLLGALGLALIGWVRRVA